MTRIQGSRRQWSSGPSVVAALIVALLGILVSAFPAAGAADARFWMNFRGTSGTSYVVTSGVPWRIDFSYLITGYRPGLSGISVELLDSPGTAGLAVHVPTSPGADGYHYTPTWQGSLLDYRTGLSKPLPAGRYLFTLVGNVDGCAQILGIATRRPTVVPTTPHPVAVRQASAIASSTLALAPYAAAASITSSLPEDPRIFVQEFVSAGRGPRTWEGYRCLQQTSDVCPGEDLTSGSALSPSHKEVTGDYYGGFTLNEWFDQRWGVKAGQTWTSRLAVHASKPGGSVFQVVVVLGR